MTARRRPRYARDHKAWGQDAKTGRRVYLRDLVRDGQTGLPVTRESYDPKHPQERPIDVYDPETLRRPAPDQDIPLGLITLPTVPGEAPWDLYPNLIGFGGIANGTLTAAAGGAVYQTGVYETGVYE